MKQNRNETINFLLLWEEDLKVMIVRGDPQEIAHALWSDRLEDLFPYQVEWNGKVDLGPLGAMNFDPNSPDDALKIYYLLKSLNREKIGYVFSLEDDGLDYDWNFCGDCTSGGFIPLAFAEVYPKEAAINLTIDAETYQATIVGYEAKKEGSVETYWVNCRTEKFYISFSQLNDVEIHKAAHLEAVDGKDPPNGLLAKVLGDCQY